ncbi:transposase [Gorillibacterium timonense]|uniref:transposase n=1 Tax=Gorillibacterium timonense TaxID=1689269 RepID=UPI001F225A50|nr:transposase [Gorillibacterium timonense]
MRFIQEQTKTVADLAEELNIPRGTLHQWMGQYRELKYEPAASGDRVREMEAKVREMNRQLQEKEQKLADVEEELAIVKSSAHLQQTKELRFRFIEDHRSAEEPGEGDPYTRFCGDSGHRLGVNLPRELVYQPFTPAYGHSPKS